VTRESIPVDATSDTASNPPLSKRDSFDDTCLPSTCRLFYVDPATLEYKGHIPWSPQLRAEPGLRGNFKIHTPQRTYYLEDAMGDSATAELWVQTICYLQKRVVPPAFRARPLPPDFGGSYRRSVGGEDDD